MKINFKIIILLFSFALISFFSLNNLFSVGEQEKAEEYLKDKYPECSFSYVKQMDRPTGSHYNDYIFNDTSNGSEFVVRIDTDSREIKDDYQHIAYDSALTKNLRALLGQYYWVQASSKYSFTDIEHKYQNLNDYLSNDACYSIYVFGTKTYDQIFVQDTILKNFYFNKCYIKMNKITDERVIDKIKSWDKLSSDTGTRIGDIVIRQGKVIN